jgi:hypothetical protein
MVSNNARDGANMSTVIRGGLILTLGAVLGVSLGVGHHVWADSPDSVELPYEELRTFTDVLDRIKRDYVEEVDDKSLLEDAIRGMLSGLERYRPRRSCCHSAQQSRLRFHGIYRFRRQELVPVPGTDRYSCPADR